MDEDVTTPRINCALFAKYRGRKVILIAEYIEDIEEGIVKVRASDQGEIIVKLPQGERIESRFTQFIGFVENHGEINEFTAMNLCLVNDEFDVPTYNSLVELSNGEHSNLFYE